MKPNFRVVFRISIIRMSELIQILSQIFSFKRMQSAIILLLFLLPSFSIAQNNGKYAGVVSPSIAERVVSVGGVNADVPGFNQQSIQFAINRVAETGGIVKLNPGTFTIITPVQMKSKVKLIGSGKETIL